MGSILDRLNAELDTIGDRVRTAFESSKLHLERSRLLGIRGKTAYKLGMMVYRKERGQEINQAELDALFAKMDDVTAQIESLDKEIDSVHADGVTVDEQPAPPAEPADAEVSKPAGGE